MFYFLELSGATSPVSTGHSCTCKLITILILLKQTLIIVILTLQGSRNGVSSAMPE